MLYNIKRLSRFPAAVARVRRVEPGLNADGDVDGHVAAGGAGRVHEEDVDPARGCADIPGVHQPEEHPILHVCVTGEDIEEAGGGGAEVDREETRTVAGGGEDNDI